MARIIRFRGKRLDNAEWVYGGYYGDDKRAWIVTVEPTEYGRSIVKHEVDPSTVGQYTELQDKNNAELYELDIIKTPYYVFGNHAGFERHTVIFENGSFGIKRERDFVHISKLRKPIKFEYVSNVGEIAVEWEHPFEVIGNIHDAKEATNE